MGVVIASRETGVLDPLEDGAESHATTLPLEMRRRQTLCGVALRVFGRGEISF
jgi:hypothetical protein